MPDQPELPEGMPGGEKACHPLTSVIGGVQSRKPSVRTGCDRTIKGLYLIQSSIQYRYTRKAHALLHPDQAHQLSEGERSRSSSGACRQSRAARNYAEWGSEGGDSGRGLV